jgi:hypothetical protein
MKLRVMVHNKCIIAPCYSGDDPSPGQIGQPECNGLPLVHAFYGTIVTAYWLRFLDFHGV